MKILSQKFFRIAFLFLIGLVLATGCFELFLRIAEFVPALRSLPVAQVSLYGPDENAGYTLRPNLNGFWDTENRAYVTTNSLGYRGRETQSGEADIVFAGHSLTEALQVEEDKTFAYLTGQHLDIETANLGLAGAQPAVIVERLRKFLPILKPRVVVIAADTRLFEYPAVLQDGAYAGYKVNADGSAAELSHGFRQSRGYKIRTSIAGDFIYWALDHIRTARIVNNSLNRGLFKDLRAQPPKAEDSEESIGTLDSFFDLWVRGEPKGHRLALEAFLKDIATLQTQNDTRVIIALTGPWDDAESTTLKDTEKAMQDTAKPYGVTVVNLTPFIQGNLPDGAASVPLKGFRPPWQGHLNEIGHKVYADAIADMIETQRLGFSKVAE